MEVLLHLLVVVFLDLVVVLHHLFVVFLLPDQFVVMLSLPLLEVKLILDHLEVLILDLLLVVVLKPHLVEGRSGLFGRGVGIGVIVGCCKTPSSGETPPLNGRSCTNGELQSYDPSVVSCEIESTLLLIQLLQELSLRKHPKLILFS